MPELSIDFETRSTVDLRKSGVYRYAEDASTGIWCMAWAFDDEEPQLWLPGEKLPARIHEHILAGGSIRAWNAQFERIIWYEIMSKRLQHINPFRSQWVCTAAEAAAMALPRSLDECARVTGVAHQKDAKGYDIMLRMSRPRSFAKDGTPVWWDVEDRKRVLYDYCLQDVRVERELVRVLRRLTPREREMYQLDQRMNDRGVRLDRELVAAAQRIVEQGQNSASQILETLTGGAVESATKVASIKRWLASRDVNTDSLDKASVLSLLSGDLPPDVRAVIEARAEASASSTAKLTAMEHVVCADGYMRGLLLYHAAGTGRWGGRLVQPHNFPRGEVENPESYIPLVLAGAYEEIDLYYPPLKVISALLRGMLLPPLGHDFIAGDYSQIEARVLNWMAGQADAVEGFRSGAKVYEQLAARIFGLDVEQITKASYERQVAKAAELGCGFQMGPAKFVSSAHDVYHVVVSKEIGEAAVALYRDTHPQVVQWWWSLNDAAIRAVDEPGSTVLVHPPGGVPVKFTKRGSYLYIILPSGRPLCYATPRVIEREVPWSTPENPQTRPSVEVSGVDSMTRRWSRYALYGGIIAENIVQAVARDIMAEGKLRAEARGYTPVLSVHDEVVTVVPAGSGTVQELEGILCELPAWGEGCPVAAEGWRGPRYRK